MPDYHARRHQIRCCKRKLILTKIVVSLFLIAFMLNSSAADQHSGKVELAEQDIKHMIVREAIEDGRIPAPLAMAIARVASGFSINTRDINGAIGLMQLQPGLVNSELGVGESKLWDPVINVRVAFFQLSRLHYRYEGQWALVLSHYFGGPLSIRFGRAQPHEYTIDEVEQVMAWWERYKQDPVIGGWSRPGLATVAPDRGRGERIESSNYPDEISRNIPCLDHCVSTMGVLDSYRQTPTIARPYRFTKGSRWRPITGTRFR